MVLFGGGLLPSLAQSLGYFPAIASHSFTLNHYSAVLTDGNFLRSLWLTFRIAALTSVLSGVLAIGFALALRQRFRGSRLALLLFQIPLPVPHLVDG